MPIEKIYGPEFDRPVLKSDGTQELNGDGTPKVEHVKPWEVRATGAESVKELDGIFDDSGPQLLHESWVENQKIGFVTITKPDGSTDEVRADHEENYRRQPGFCVHAIRPTFVVNVPWTGSMKREGIVRQRIRYRNGEREILEERR